ncbi:MAG: molybdopterin-guanine dinucleotide biosynthesis protein B [Promethearchaeota archaeon]
MKIIHLIGNSGSGKTHLITNMVKLLKEKLNFNVAVIKNIHEHEVDKPGKDSYKYSEAGAVFSITRNVNNENTIFLKRDIKITQLIEWLTRSPYKIDVIFIEGFKKLNYPSILCISDMEEIKAQIDDSVKVISGIICKKNTSKKQYINIPILDIVKNFSEFLDIFEIR